VHYPWTIRFTNRKLFFADVMNNRVSESVRDIPRAWVHREPKWLVDNQKVLILIYNL
jgi:hypothetical protein